MLLDCFIDYNAKSVIAKNIRNDLGFPLPSLHLCSLAHHKFQELNSKK